MTLTFGRKVSILCGYGAAGSPAYGAYRVKTIPRLLAVLLIISQPAAWAQASAEPSASAASAAGQLHPGNAGTMADEKGKPGTFIRHSDAGATIEEVREGADTKSITVTPANNAPQYNIVPDARSGQPGNNGDQGGKRVWKVLSF